MCCFCPLATVFTWSIGTWFVGRRCSCQGRWCQRSTDSGWLTRIICISIREVDFGDNDLGEILYEEQGDCCIINDGASSLTIPDLVKHLCIASGWVLLSFIQFYHLAQREFCTLLDTVGMAASDTETWTWSIVLYHSAAGLVYFITQLKWIIDRW